MRRITSLFSLCLLIVLFSACQEEDQSIGHPERFNPKTDLPSFNPKLPGLLSKNPGQSIPLSDHVSYRLPRFPRPLPCPVLAGCQLPIPEVFMSVPDGNIQELVTELYTSSGKLYASSSKEYGGQVSYQEGNAWASLVVIDDQAKSEQLILRTQIAYEINGKSFEEELVDDNVSVNLDEYFVQGRAIFRRPFPIPRPLPCMEKKGEVFKCQIPQLELHTIVPKGLILDIQAILYNTQGDLYAGSGKEFGGQVTYQDEEALATLVVVDQEIVPENLILAIQVTYEIDGEVISEEIYEEGLSFME
ncbi:hypothetical protein [Tunicatimonas pelagia]|uniref:hypothetical protein n=1 Tax=Tunicatimonas pelagia TaxID=931531 RepID=UPI002665DADB|nr:hypothetical protein [Tunicatimonas pelagia]WKN42018.1 hypothetical protein P0M28_23530 [Tunicatimonas pelagia]